MDGEPWFDNPWRGEKDMKKALDELALRRRACSASQRMMMRTDEDVEISEEASFCWRRSFVIHLLGFKKQHVVVMIR